MLEKQPRNVRLSEDKNSVIILDQSLLPTQEVFLELEKKEDLYEAIYHLRVRGAPAIGIFAGFAIYVISKKIKEKDFIGFYNEFKKNKDYLNSSRPTAVNLSWALNRIDEEIVKNKDKSVEEIKSLMEKEAVLIQQEDIEMCKKISQFGLELIKDGDGIITHCNAGPLATSLYGTALGPLILGKEKGMDFKVFADETRPLLQGARLTTYELKSEGIDVTLICDNMASIVMKNGWINACFVGCDRVARNGDTANKIGTSGLAILAKHYEIPFFVLGPTSTIDMDCATGEDIEIEIRDGKEISTKWYKKPMAPEGINFYNPAFDVTDHQLIDGIITEKGICRAPYTESLEKLFN